MSAKRYKLKVFAVEPYEATLPDLIKLTIVMALCVPGIFGAIKLGGIFEKDETRKN